MAAHAAFEVVDAAPGEAGALGQLGLGQPVGPAMSAQEIAEWRRGGICHNAAPFPRWVPRQFARGA
jgi:hypothetical protein